MDGVKIVYVWLFILSITACKKADPEDKLFTLLGQEETGIDFSNHLKEGPELNILNYLYYYNGGGVAAGDINNDGLTDLYFTANELPNKLYLNRSNRESASFQFEDITEAAGVVGLSGWTTGVTMADVNGDGWLDIYVSQVAAHEGLGGYNQLYINSGDTSTGFPTFTEEAAKYNLDHRGYATQAAFFDYDRDGDLDVYLLNHTVHSPETYVPAVRGRQRSPLGDKLMRNDTPLSSPLKGKEGERGIFTDVSEEAGIYGSIVGYGLSVSIADINNDGWPDIYVGNDFHENDYLYLNNRDGTFTESLEKMISHTSRFSMGNDIADINNDGRLDIAVLDMKPEDERVLKTSAGEDPYDIFQYKLAYGYNHQYARNTLQLQVGDSLFSEIGQLAGIDATDWSWSALFADLDNDGWKDLFISNGIYRRPNNKDYIDFVSNQEIQASLSHGDISENINLINLMPTEPVANYAYRNQGGMSFSNKAEDWGLAKPGFSNGTAYADLDNDGDLDLIINNVNAPASIYLNHASEKNKYHYLSLKLEGDDKNTFGLGSKVWAYAGDKVIFQELMTTRGFQSSVEPKIHLGVGELNQLDSLLVTWPDGRQQLIQNVETNQQLMLKQEDTGLRAKSKDSFARPKIFKEVSSSLHIPYVHQENNYVDFSQEALMPHMLSQEGPALAVADVDGDGLEDIFAGGAAHQAAQLLLQQADGTFINVPNEVWKQDKDYEDIDAVFFDANGDSFPDLYVASGGNQNDISLSDRLYLNDGKGNFSRAETALPIMEVNTACVTPADYDQDGDTDLFVGGRSVPGQYGINPRSFLLENDGKGKFTDVTLKQAPPLAEVGMITAAVWADYDQDGWQDLVLAGTWMPITLFRNVSGKLEQVEAPGLEKSHGWWNSLAAADMDGDGDTDFIAGNLGLNSVVKAGPDEPATLYIKDFDGNGSLDPIFCFYKNGVSYPFATKGELTKQIVPLRKKFIKYSDYADSQLKDIFSENELQDAEQKKAYTFAHTYIENLGDGKFSMHSLPLEGQFSTVNAVLIEDFNQDQKIDILLAGNADTADPKQGRYDASYGLLLLGKSDGTFEALEPGESGLVLKGIIRKISKLNSLGVAYLIFGKNNDSLQIYQKVQAPL